MNRILLTTFSAWLLASTTATAQVSQKVSQMLPKASSEVVFNKTHLQAPKTLNKSLLRTAATRSGLADNQIYMGPYKTDELREAGNGISFGTGTFKVGVVIDRPMAMKYNGAKIVAIRYGLCSDVVNPKVFVKTVNSEGKMSDTDVVSQAAESGATGWNTVTLPTPYEINVDGSDVAAFMIGYEFTTATDPYAVSTVATGTATDLYAYGDLGQGEAWNGLGTNYGALSVQCIVEKDGGFHVVDGMLSDFKTPRYVQKGNKMDLNWTCTSFLGDIDNAEFGVRINDTEIATLPYNGTISEEGVSLNVSIEVPEDAVKMASYNNISLYIKKLNGETPTDKNTLGDDAITNLFVPYANSFNRQKQLVEFFTSQAGQYCKYGDDLLTTLSEKRDDLAMVGVHASLTSGTDQWALRDAGYIISFSAGSVPSASLNRYYYNSTFNGDNLAVATDYAESYKEQAAELISAAIDESNKDYPAFATVDLATSYDTNAKTINIKVSGQNVSDFKQVMGDDAVLTVYLTHDNLSGEQANGSSSILKYKNNHVLRKIVSDPLGDAISWDGTSYEKNYQVALDDSWKTNRLNVVAFISRPIKYNSDNVFTTAISDAWVTNANSCKLGESTATGIDNAITETENVTEIARYTLDGVKISAPVKGVNIVKYSNGKTVKVVVE